MYKPAPVRPKKTTISRSRNGCTNCRQRRSKCDERKPSCSTCVRLGRTCGFYQKNLEFRVTTLSASEGVLSTKQPDPSTGAGALRDGERLAEGVTTNLIVSPDNNSEHGRAVVYPHVGLDFSLSGSRLDTERYMFYTTHWEKHCLPALSPIFSQLFTQMEQCPVLHDAVLALSACNMSRMHPEVKRSDILRAQDITYRPHLTHHFHSQMYYNSAIRRLVRLSAGQYRHNLLSILTAMLLFCYMESSLCNFRGYYCHVEGISSIQAIDMEKIKADSSGSELLTTLELSKYYNWWIRIHFSTLNFQNSQSALQTSLQYHDLKESKSARRAILLSILCESYRLGFKASLQWWNSQNLPSGPIDCPNSFYYEDYRSLLLGETKRLDKWESELAASDLPTEPFLPESPSIWTFSDDYSRLEPLHFLSHEAATNYAYYAAARIMQCSWVTHELNPNNPISNNNIEDTYWIILLLRIIHGMKHSDCVRQNAYTIGISGLLLACVLRCTSLSAGLCIETWLKDFQQAQVFEEGSLPISQIIAVVCMINQQRRDGFDIFAISPVLEDGGGNGKFDSYNNQSLAEVLVFGRYRQTGSAFSRCVSLKNDSEGE